VQFLFDDLARIMASPLPRRQAFKLLGGALATAFLGSLGMRPAAGAAVTCPKGESKCGTGGLCCPTGLCCDSPGEGCKPFCLTKGETCCGMKACTSSQTCCKTGRQPFCATKGYTCCGNTSCSPGQPCCPGCSSPFCADRGRTCCGMKSCAPGEVCCNGVCCAQGETCKNGRCSASKCGPDQ
jgi:hypothetical protein